MYARYLVLCALGLGASLSVAAENTNENESRLEVPAAIEIEEIIVTAMRRETGLQATALSIGVLTPGEIEDSALRDFDDYWRRIPSMSVTDSGPFGTLTVIRGLSANFGAQTDEPLTALYLDETPMTNPAGFFTSPPDFYLVDMERVEVLRGPQGTLFGASSMGGAIRNITRKPDASISDFSVEAGVSDTRHGGTNGEINAVVNRVLVPERSAIRVAAYYRDDEGFVDDIGLNRSNVNWKRTEGIRLSASTLWGEKLSLTGKIQYQDAEAGSYNEVDPNGKPEIGLPTESDYQLALLVPESRSNEVILYNLEAKYTTSFADWLSVTSYFDHETTLVIDIADEMNFFFGQYLPAPIEGQFSQEVFTQEFRVVSNSGGTFGWLAGVFYLDQDMPSTETITAPGLNNTPFCIDVDPPPPPGAPYDTCSGFPDGEEIMNYGSSMGSREEYGLYGDISYDIGDRWQATVGARWYDIEQSDVGEWSGFFSGGFNVPSSFYSSEDGTTWRGSLAFHPTNDTMIYGLVSQGFRPGGANDVDSYQLCSGATDTYESDSLWNYEIGTRTTWLDSRLTVNATAYYIDWSDAQVSVFGMDCGAYYTANSGEATSRGAEVELVATISDRWSLLLTGGYVDSKLEQGLDDPGINAPAGTALPYVPETTASLTSNHRFPIMGNREGFVLAEIEHTGRSYSSLDLDFRTKLSAYTLVNLRAGVASGDWTTEVFAENLLDEQANFSCCRINGEYVTNRPRTVGMRVSYGR